MARGLERRYRDRLQRLRRRADYLRAMLVNGRQRSEASVSHITAEISALDWAVATLAPWFERDDEPALSVGADPGTPSTRDKEIS